MTVLIPLHPNDKRPAVRGWASPAYSSPAEFPGNVGLRTDGIVVIDCDTREAAAAWAANGHPTPTQVETKRGVHFYYRLPDGAGLRPGPLTGNTDIKTGPGAFVLIPPSTIDDFAYSWVGERWDFDPASLPEAPVELIRSLLPTKPELLSKEEGWDQIPDGRRNLTLTALAGSLRKQGAGPEAIAATLATFNANRCDPPLADAEVVAIVRSVLRYEPEPYLEGGEISIQGDDDDDEERPNIIWAAGMEVPPPPRWLQFPLLPAARLVLVDGNEGIGKGMFATWIAVQMASGQLDHEPAPVLWGSTEDDPAEDILRRLLAAGYDAEKHAGIGFLNADAMGWRYPGHLAELASVIRDTGAKILVLDPGRSFLGPPSGMSAAEFTYNSEAHVRPGLEALNLLARKLDVTVVFIHHWNKNLTASIRVRSSGSAAFAQTVRHRVTLNYLNGSHALAVEKSNMTSREHTVFSYELESVEELSTARFVLGGLEPCVDLDEWETLHRGDSKITEDEEVDLNTAIVLDAAGYELEPGALFWNRDQLRARFGFSHTLARSVLAQLKADGSIHIGARNQLVLA